MRGHRIDVCAISDVHNLDRRGWGGVEQSMQRICVFAAFDPVTKGVTIVNSRIWALTAVDVNELLLSTHPRWRSRAR